LVRKFLKAEQENGRGGAIEEPEGKAEGQPGGETCSFGKEDPFYNALTAGKKRPGTSRLIAPGKAPRGRVLYNICDSADEFGKNQGTDSTARKIVKGAGL